jgi:hypothetical protein
VTWVVTHGKKELGMGFVEREIVVVERGTNN